MEWGINMFEIFERIFFLKMFIREYQGCAIGVLNEAQDELRYLRAMIK